jgi:hypothetical protein
MKSGEHANMAAPTIDDLHARREQINAQLNALKCQHADIARDVQLAEENRRAAHDEGRNIAHLAERRRYREIGLRETSWLIAEIRGWLAETDAEIRRRAPNDDPDRDLQQLVADMHASDEYRARRPPGRNRQSGQHCPAAARPGLDRTQRHDEVNAPARGSLIEPSPAARAEPRLRRATVALRSPTALLPRRPDLGERPGREAGRGSRDVLGNGGGNETPRYPQRRVRQAHTPDARASGVTGMDADR